jgi:hypothetical protein
VPIAISGTSWLRFGARIKVGIGEPVAGEGRPDRPAVAAMTSTLRERLQSMLGDNRAPERTGRLAAWVTERFNEWPEGSRDAALAAQLAEEELPSAQAV